MKTNFLLITGLIFLFILSCNSSSEGNTQLKTTETEIAVEHLKKYICPMMCDEGKNHAGVCDVCEMDLVLNENYKE